MALIQDISIQIIISITAI